MGWLFSRILAWLGSGVLDRVLVHLERKAGSAVERERISADVAIEAVKGEIAARSDARAVLVAEQGWWVTSLIRPLIVYPFIIWLWFVVADTIFLFEWNVAALPKPLDEWFGYILAAYFLTRPFEKVGASIARRLGGQAP